MAEIVPPDSGNEPNNIAWAEPTIRKILDSESPIHVPDGGLLVRASAVEGVGWRSVYALSHGHNGDGMAALTEEWHSTHQTTGGYDGGYCGWAQFVIDPYGGLDGVLVRDLERGEHHHSTPTGATLVLSHHVSPHSGLRSDPADPALRAAFLELHKSGHPFVDPLIAARLGALGLVPHHL